MLMMIMSTTTTIFPSTLLPTGLDCIGSWLSYDNRTAGASCSLLCDERPNTQHLLACLLLFDGHEEVGLLSLFSTVLITRLCFYLRDLLVITFLRREDCVDLAKEEEALVGWTGGRI